MEAAGICGGPVHKLCIGSPRLQVTLRLVDFLQPSLQLSTAVEAMHVMRVLEPTNGHPKHRAALGVWALERYSFFFVSHDCVYERHRSNGGWPLSVAACAGAKGWT